MAEERYNIYRSTVHWRYAMARPMLTFFDVRLVFFIALFAFHIRWWTFLLLITALTLFGVAAQLNYSLHSVVRLVKSRMAGAYRSAVPYTRLRPMVDHHTGHSTNRLHHTIQANRFPDSVQIVLPIVSPKAP